MSSVPSTAYSSPSLSILLWWKFVALAMERHDALSRSTRRERNEFGKEVIGLAFDYVTLRTSAGLHLPINFQPLSIAWASVIRNGTKLSRLTSYPRQMHRCTAECVGCLIRYEGFTYDNSIDVHDCINAICVDALRLDYSVEVISAKIESEIMGLLTFTGVPDETVFDLARNSLEQHAGQTRMMLQL